MDTKACRGAVNVTSCNDTSDMKSCDGSKKKNCFKIAFNRKFLNTAVKICDRNVQKCGIHKTSQFCKIIYLFQPINFVYQ
jgi:hypothetical protein